MHEKCVNCWLKVSSSEALDMAKHVVSILHVDDMTAGVSSEQPSGNTGHSAAPIAPPPTGSPSTSGTPHGVCSAPFLYGGVGLNVYCHHITVMFISDCM